MLHIRYQHLPWRGLGRLGGRDSLICGVEEDEEAGEEDLVVLRKVARTRVRVE